MTLDFLASTVAPIVQGIASMVGVAGLLLVWLQIRATNHWNRANTQHMLLTNLPSQELENAVWTLVEELPRESKALTDEASEAIYASVNDWTNVKTFLNKFEQLCAAINSNSVDDRYAYSMHGAKIQDAFDTFERYIYFTRERAEDEAIYLELEVVATRWGEVARKEAEFVKAKTDALKATREATRAID